MMIICHESSNNKNQKLLLLLTTTTPTTNNDTSKILHQQNKKKIRYQQTKRFLTSVIIINNHIYFILLLFVLLHSIVFVNNNINVHSFTIVRLPSPSLSVSVSTTSTSIMGIKGFRSWFESQFPNAIVEVPIHYTSNSNKNDKNYNKKNPITKNKSRQKDDHHGSNINKNQTNDSSANNAEYFDHVLIDMNQLLHQVMRKSKSDEHGLTLLIKELDNILINIARPKQSLVLAIDGSPSAAKLATQRLRRYSNVYKNQLKVNQYTKLLSISEIIKKQDNNNTLQTTTDIPNESNIIATTENNINDSNNNQATTNINNYNNVNNKKKTIMNSKRTIFQKKRRAIAETRTLCITPGTEFMKKTEQALMYWAWQRLSSRSPNVLLLSDDYNYNIMNSINVYISPSTVPGEGEVKILEWIYNHIPNNNNNKKMNNNNNNNIEEHENSIAILGGDSDLVLESLMIPLSCTHNVFVLLPDGNKRYLAVNIWETTRSLDQLLANKSKQNNNKITKTPTLPTSPLTHTIVPCHSTSLTNMMNIRCDIALLLILNGNDYLPKLRGSSGFNLLFHTYIKLQRQWFATHGNDNISSFLYNSNTLEFNIDFCIEYFQRLDNATPKKTKWTNTASAVIDTAISLSSPIQILHNMVQGGDLPSPLRYEIIREKNNLKIDEYIESTTTMNNNINNNKILGIENDDINASDLEDDDIIIDNNDDNDGSDRVLIRVELGKPGTEEYYTNEIWHRTDVPLKIARKKLAEIVLKDLVYGTNDDDDNDEEDEDDNDEDDEDDVDDHDGFGGINKSGFEWEIKQRVEGKVDRYLYGLLWNVQTYQDGICADYSFNYGKRLAPSANDIVQFFQNVKKQNSQQQIMNNKTTKTVKTTISMIELSNGRTFSPPVSAGISCLAALPSQVKYLVPIPYRYLSDETVEGIYSSCMDNEDNYFDIIKFEKLCMEQIELLPSSEDSKGKQRNTMNSNHWNNDDDDNDHYWSVMSKVHIPLNRPFEPPIPFAEGFTKLRPNNRIKLHRIIALSTPKLRTFNIEKEMKKKNNNKQSIPHDEDSSSSSSLVIDHGPAFVNITSVDQVTSYKIAYKKRQHDDKKHHHIDTVRHNATSTTKTIIATTATPPKELADDNDMIPNELVTTSTTSKKNSKNSHNISKTVVANSEQKRDETISTTVTQETGVYVTTTDGQSAMAVLKQLADASLIGEIKWENTVLSSPRSSERIRLIVEKSIESQYPNLLDKSLVFEHDRVTNKVSRKTVQQHLCSLALCNIAGSSIIWTNMSYKEFRSNITMNASNF